MRGQFWNDFEITFAHCVMLLSSSALFKCTKKYSKYPIDVVVSSHRVWQRVFPLVAMIRLNYLKHRMRSVSLWWNEFINSLTYIGSHCFHLQLQILANVTFLNLEIITELNIVIKSSSFAYIFQANFAFLDLWMSGEQLVWKALVFGTGESQEEGKRRSMRGKAMFLFLQRTQKLVLLCLAQEKVRMRRKEES